MKDPTILVSIATVLVLMLGPPPAAALYNNICRLFADGVVLRDPYACDAYITCTNLTEVSTKCGTGKIYSIDSKKCVASETTCDNPCAPDFDGFWVSDPQSCKAYYFCANGVGTHGVCLYDLHFDEDKQECIYPVHSECDAEDSFCHIVPTGINWKDEKACDGYYSCSKTHVLTSNTCKTGLLYSREAGKCVDKAIVNGCDSLPTGVCLTSKNKPIKSTFVSDSATCRGYYYCADKGTEADENPSWGQCPAGEFFNANTQTCMDPILVACDGDRCDGREDGFINSSQSCQHYDVCKNGVTTATKQCADQRFFDEKRGACTAEVIEYKACV